MVSIFSSNHRKNYWTIDINVVHSSQVKCVNKCLTPIPKVIQYVRNVSTLRWLTNKCGDAKTIVWMYTRTPHNTVSYLQAIESRCPNTERTPVIIHWGRESERLSVHVGVRFTHGKSAHNNNVACACLKDPPPVNTDTHTNTHWTVFKVSTTVINQQKLLQIIQADWDSKVWTQV